MALSLASMTPWGLSRNPRNLRFQGRSTPLLLALTSSLSFWATNLVTFSRTRWAAFSLLT